MSQNLYLVYAPQNVSILYIYIYVYVYVCVWYTEMSYNAVYRYIMPENICYRTEDCHYITKTNKHKPLPVGGGD